MNALGFRVIGNLIADDEAMTYNNISEVNESNENPTKVKYNSPENLHQVNQNI